MIDHLALVIVMPLVAASANMGNCSVPASIVACAILVQDGDATEGMDQSGVDTEATAPATSVEGAADADTTEPRLDQAQAKSLDEAMHYVLIASPDLAAAHLTALFGSDPTDEQLAGTVDGALLTDRVEEVISRGRHLQTVGPMVRELEVRIERGRGSMARNSARIVEAVSMLGGTMRQNLLARKRLLAAGEYAMPALLQAMVESRNPTLQVAARDVIAELGRHAVQPLGAALPQLDPASAKEICGTLGQIGWPSAAPVLLTVSKDSSLPADVRQVASEAYARVGGVTTDFVDACVILSRRYFYEDPSLVSYPDDATNNLWSYDPHGGLTPTPVPTEIFCQVMAMKLAWTALGAQPDSRPALALFVAADLRRANLLPSGVEDPVFGGSKYTPEFFAMMSGPTICLDVLGMALDSSDTALVIDAIRAVAGTAGATNLTSGGGRLPMVDCLSYPDRRVRFEGALALAGAAPATQFAQHAQVVPILAEMVRSGSAPRAVVIAAEESDRGTLGSSLQAVGFEVLLGGRDHSSVSQAIALNTGLDLVAVTGERGSIIDTIRAFRIAPLTSVVPIVVLPSGDDSASVSAEFANDRRTVISQQGGGDEAFAAAVRVVSERSFGGAIDEDSTLGYVSDAIDALVAIARSSNTRVFDLRAGESALLSALSASTDSLRIAVAEVVAAIPTPRSQRALMAAALSSEGEEQSALLDWTATSARRVGNLLEPGQVQALRNLIDALSGEQANAAGRLYGALDMSSDEAVRLLRSN